jgi:4a-hydroxytetrahydrobiopterin dehydratase
VGLLADAPAGPPERRHDGPGKQESIMTAWRKQGSGPTYDTSEIQARLAAELPGWYLEDGWIRRKYKTSGWKATLMVVSTVGHVAEAAWHHPDLTVSYAFVIVKLMTHDAKGVTDKDFELARRIEDVVAWRPGAGSALEGTPDDPRFRYIRHEP